MFYPQNAGWSSKRVCMYVHSVQQSVISRYFITYYDTIGVWYNIACCRGRFSICFCATPLGTSRRGSSCNMYTRTCILETYKYRRKSGERFWYAHYFLKRPSLSLRHMHDDWTVRSHTISLCFLPAGILAIGFLRRGLNMFLLFVFQDQRGLYFLRVRFVL